MDILEVFLFVKKFWLTEHNSVKQVEKKKGKEGEDLLSGSDDQGGGIWDSISK